MDKYDQPHGHSLEEVKAAGGKTGCPVCLRADLKMERTRGEFLGVSKLAEKCWNMNAEDAANLVHEMSSRAHAWLNAHPEKSEPVTDKL